MKGDTMNSKSKRAELEELEKRKNELHKQLDQKLQDFIDQLPSLAETWIKSETRRKIEDNPEHVLELGTERMGELKQKMNALIEQLPSICDTINDNKDKWPHRKKQAKTQPSMIGSEIGKESFFPSCFRVVISHLGAVLGEFGLVTEQADKYNTWEKVADGKYRYQINPGFDGRDVPAVNEYNEIMKEYEVIAPEINIKLEELEKSKAGELWDSV